MLCLSGSPHDIGFKHGKELRDKVVRLYENWYNGRASLIDKSEFEEIIKKTVPKYETFFQNEAPEVLEEIRGIAEGSGMSYEKILLLNVLEELPLRLEDMRFFTLGGCSQVAVTGDITASGKLLIGKNEDGGSWDRDEYVHVKFEPKKGYKFITAIFPGRVGPVIGLSETGLSYAQSSAGVEGDMGMGWPRVLLFRPMMERCKAVDDALDFISAHNYAIRGINLMLGDRKGNVVLVEKTHSHQAERYPEDGILIGVNIFRSSGMRPFFDRKNIPHIKDSVLRIDRIHEILEPQKGKIDYETLKSVLRDHQNGKNSICCHGESPSRAQTGSSYMYDPQSLKIQIAEGLPCQNEYFEYTP